LAGVECRTRPPRDNTGHTISAAGAIEAIFTLAMLRGGWIAPSVNAERIDPELAGDPPVAQPESRPPVGASRTRTGSAAPT